MCPLRSAPPGSLSRFGTEWVWPVLAIIGLIVILTAFELLSVAIAAKWDTDESIDWEAEPKRAA